jgi:hypothetical protein
MGVDRSGDYALLLANPWRSPPPKLRAAAEVQSSDQGWQDRGLKRAEKLEK